MIEPGFGGFDVTCDSCYREEHFDTDEGYWEDEWAELMWQMRKIGWRSRKRRGEWYHYCPRCAIT